MVSGVDLLQKLATVLKGLGNKLAILGAQKR